MTIQFNVLHGESGRQLAKDLASLRIHVFREYPYLYEGDLAYEEKYLERYFRSKESLIAFAKDGNHVIGATTALPLTDESESVKKPFLDRGIDPDDYMYFGESVVLTEYRNQGIGKKFFELRLKHALSTGRSRACFCAVDRGHDHPLKPETYRNLVEFWERMGFEPSGFHCLMSWKDLTESGESPKKMNYFINDQIRDESTHKQSA